jgi:cyclic lactone autoinducer peptide
MFKNKVLPKTLSALAAVSVKMAAISANSCFPLPCYQPKMPKSLIKTE